MLFINIMPFNAIICQHYFGGPEYNLPKLIFTKQEKNIRQISN